MEKERKINNKKKERITPRKEGKVAERAGLMELRERERESGEKELPERRDRERREEERRCGGDVLLRWWCW
jgi:hypothetical protein